MAIKNLCKKLAILTLSLTTVLPVYAQPECSTEDAGCESYKVSRLIRPKNSSVKVTVEEKLHSCGGVVYREREYVEKDWVSFLVRNLLVGPNSVTVTDVEFRTAPPADDGLPKPMKVSDRDKEAKGSIDVYISADRSKLMIVCKSSISETANYDISAWRFLVTNKLFF